MTINEYVSAISLEKDHIVNLVNQLHEHNPYDSYWGELLELSKKPDFFEPCMLQSWIGKNRKPKKILEIGTRTGGSLISLLSSYNSFEDVKVYSFDLWVENLRASFLSRIPVLRSVLRKLPLNKSLALNIVKKNLKIFSIPVSIITFISGDSKKTVPAFFRANPAIKFDYILVDGAHDAQTAAIDLENVASYITKDGFLVFDDIGPESYHLLSVWEKFKANHKDDFLFYENMHRKGVGWAIKK